MTAMVPEQASGSHLSNDAGAIVAAINGLVPRFDQLQGQMGLLAGQMTTLQTDVGSLKTDVGSLKSEGGTIWETKYNNKMSRSRR